MNKQIDITETLDWYLWAGVDETCGEAPNLLLKKENISNITQTKINNEKSKIFEPKKNNINLSVIKNAKDICEKAKTIEELKESLTKFEGCNLKNTAASTILGEGCQSAKIMLIGEAPGADEDRLGRPFVGKCGKLLDKILKSVQLNREECYITNVLPWRPPGNRTPTDDEIAICLPFLKRQIEIIQPEIIILLGGIALKSVMDNTDSISRARGKWMEYFVNENKKVYVIATYHPSYLLRSSAQKSKVWIDFLRLRKKINEI